MCEALDVHHHQLDWPELCTFVGGGGTVTCQDRPNFWKFFNIDKRYFSVSTYVDLLLYSLIYI